MEAKGKQNQTNTSSWWMDDALLCLTKSNILVEIIDLLPPFSLLGTKVTSFSTKLSQENIQSVPE